MESFESYQSNFILKLITTIKRYRDKYGLSQVQLSRKCKVCDSTICKIENQFWMPRLTTILRMLFTLNMELHIRHKEDKYIYDDLIFKNFGTIRKKDNIKIHIYYNTKEYENLYVARLFKGNAPTNIIVVEKTIEKIREVIQKNMFKIPTHTQDDTLIEVYVL